jgi:hypothetical protein
MGSNPMPASTPEFLDLQMDNSIFDTEPFLASFFDESYQLMPHMAEDMYEDFAAVSARFLVHCHGVQFEREQFDCD